MICLFGVRHAVYGAGHFNFDNLISARLQNKPNKHAVINYAVIHAVGVEGKSVAVICAIIHRNACYAIGVSEILNHISLCIKHIRETRFVNNIIRRILTVEPLVKVHNEGIATLARSEVGDVFDCLAVWIGDVAVIGVIWHNSYPIIYISG